MQHVFGTDVDELFMLLFFRICTPHTHMLPRSRTHALCKLTHTQQQLMGVTKHKGCNVDTGAII